MLFIFLSATENNGSLGGLFVMVDVTSFVHASMFRRFFNSQTEGKEHKVTQLHEIQLESAAIKKQQKEVGLTEAGGDAA